MHLSSLLVLSPLETIYQKSLLMVLKVHALLPSRPLGKNRLGDIFGFNTNSRLAASALTISISDKGELKSLSSQDGTHVRSSVKNTAKKIC